MTDFNKSIRDQFGLCDQEFEIIRSYFKPEKLQKNDFFLRSDKICDKMSLITSGIMRMYALSEGKEITHWICTEGLLFTDVMGFFFDQPNRWNVQALSDVELQTVNKSDYRELCREFPGWNEIEKKFIYRCFGMTEDRVFTHLSKSAEERYNLYFAHNKELFNQVPLQYIASVLGMSPETLSRIELGIRQILDLCQADVYECSRHLFRTITTRMTKSMLGLIQPARLGKFLLATGSVESIRLNLVGVFCFHFRACHIHFRLLGKPESGCLDVQFVPSQIFRYRYCDSQALVEQSITYCLRCLLICHSVIDRVSGFRSTYENSFINTHLSWNSKKMIVYFNRFKQLKSRIYLDVNDKQKSHYRIAITTDYKTQFTNEGNKAA